MAAAALPIISALGPAIGQLVGGIFGGRQNAEQQRRLEEILQRAIRGDEAAAAEWQRIAGPLLNRTNETGDLFQRQLVDMLPFLNEGSENIRPIAEDAFRNNPYEPGTQEYLDYFRQVNQGVGGTRDTADAVFQGGGWTPGYADLFERLGPLMSGWGNNAQNALGDVGSNLVGQRGQTALTQGLGDRALEASVTGGMNPTLQAALQSALGILGSEGRSSAGSALTQRAQDLLRSGGLSPDALAGSSASLQGVREGGRTRGSDFMSNRGEELAGREALLPMDQAVSAARDEAGNRLRAGARAALRQARARGGGQFSMGSDELFDAQMEIAGGVGDAAQRQRLGQQQLRQQENQIGAGLLQGGEGASTARLGQFSDLFSSLQGIGVQGLNVGSNLATEVERIAAGREGTAFGAIPGTQNAGTNVMQALLSSGLAGGDLENARMRTGTEMSQAQLGTMLQALGLNTQGMGNQNQYALGAGNLGLNAGRTQADINSMGLQGFLGSGQAGTQRASEFVRALLGVEGGRQALYGLGLQGSGQSANTSTNLAGQQNNVRQSYIGQSNPYAPGGTQQNPWANLGGGAGTIIGSLGSISDASRNNRNRTPGGDGGDD